MKTKIVSTGKLPPPIGGVTIFLKYFTQALSSKKNIQHDFFKLKDFYKYKKSILHINSSNSFKRFLYVLIGRFFFAKVFIVKHGGVFNLNNFFVNKSLCLSDGVFCLNDNVKMQLESINIKNFKHTTIFLENKIEIFQKVRNVGKTKLLLYVNNDSKLDGKSVYGADFVINCMDDISSDYELTVIDLSSSYKDFFILYPTVNYIEEPQDFINVLRGIDIYIRPTRTDGMSVALLEAGLCGVKCLASNVVERPGFVVTYQLDSKDDFLKKLNYINGLSHGCNAVNLSSVDQVLSFMNS